MQGYQKRYMSNPAGYQAMSKQQKEKEKIAQKDRHNSERIGVYKRSP